MIARALILLRAPDSQTLDERIRAKAGPDRKVMKYYPLLLEDHLKWPLD